MKNRVNSKSTKQSGLKPGRNKVLGVGSFSVHDPDTPTRKSVATPLTTGTVFFLLIVAGWIFIITDWDTLASMSHATP